MERKNQWTDLITFVLVVFSGLFVAQFIAVLCLLPFYSFRPDAVMEAVTNPLNNPEIKIQLLFIQGVTSFVAFVVTPLVFIRWKEGQVIRFLYKRQDLNLNLMMLACLVMIVSVPFTSVLVEWNEAIKLPDQLSGIENWAREKEDFLKEMTELLTKLDNIYELIIGIVVIALIPGLGEEIVFRGYFQNKISQLTGRPHIAIWLSAFLFSAIHLQFYGFIPRLALGALFGYLYYFTGQFHLSVLAHFTNNALTLLLIYLKNKDLISFDIEKEESVPVFAAVMSFIFTIGLFLLIKRNFSYSQKENSKF